MGMYVWEPEDDRARDALKRQMREQEGAGLARDVLDRLDSWDQTETRRDVVHAAIGALDAILGAADAALDDGRVAEFTHWAEAADRMWQVVSEVQEAVMDGQARL